MTPPGWHRTTLAAVARLGSGGTPQARKSEFYDGDIPWAVIGDLNDGIVTSTKRTITAAGLDASSAKWVPSGAVLIGMYGSIGKLGISGIPLTTNQAIAFVIPGPDVDTKFLFYYLLSQRRQLDAMGKGATQRNISQTILRPWPVALPDLDEQRRIVEILEDHLSHLGAAEKGLADAVTRLEALARARLDSAMAAAAAGSEPEAGRVAEVCAQSRAETATTRKPPVGADVDGLTLPPGTYLSLESVTDPTRTIRYGILKPASERGDVPYVEVRNLTGQDIDPGSLKTTSAQMDRQFAGARVQPHDLVVAVRGSYLRGALVPDGLWANLSRDVARIAPVPEYSPRFLQHWHSTSWVRHYLQQRARGVAVKGVNIATLRAMPVPAVSSEKQIAAVRRIDRDLAVIGRMQRDAESTGLRSAHLRRALLRAAFSGKLAGRHTDNEVIEELAEAMA